MFYLRRSRFLQYSSDYSRVSLRSTSCKSRDKRPSALLEKLRISVISLLFNLNYAHLMRLERTGRKGPLGDPRNDGVIQVWPGDRAGFLRWVPAVESVAVHRARSHLDGNSGCRETAAAVDALAVSGRFVCPCGRPSSEDPTGIPATRVGRSERET